MTLRELRELIDATKGLRTPTAKALRESGIAIVVSNVEGGNGLTVYQNGFAIYQRDGKMTVLPADRYNTYTYSFVTDEEKLSESFFLEQEYYVLLSLLGEDRLIRNMNSTSELHEISYSDETEEWGALKDDGQDVLGKILRDELMGEIYEILTPKQAKALELFYIDQLTTREIGKIMGISHQAVTNLLEKAKGNIRKNFEKF